MHTQVMIIHLLYTVAKFFNRLMFTHSLSAAATWEARDSAASY